MKTLGVALIISMLYACTTPAEEDEQSNNTAPVEDAGLEMPDAAAPDVAPDAEEEEPDYRKCLSITDPAECRAWGVCQLINFYPVTLENGQCVLSQEASEQICTVDELPQDSPNFIWVRFNEDGTYDVGLVRERAGHQDWQRCHDGVDVEECACEGVVMWVNPAGEMP